MVPSNMVSVKDLWSELAGHEVEVTEELLRLTTERGLQLRFDPGAALAGPIPTDD